MKFCPTERRERPTISTEWKASREELEEAVEWTTCLACSWEEVDQVVPNPKPVSSQLHKKFKLVWQMSITEPPFR
jgi:hypothetical protein